MTDGCVDEKLELTPYDIHLWLAFPAELAADDPLLATYAGLLSDDEHQRCQRFRFPRLRHQYLLTRGLVRTTLSRYAAVAPQDWRFTTNDYGRPKIANSGPLPPLRFNLSHADGLILCGVVLAREIGVDVEDTRRQALTMDIADRFFSEAECRDLHALPEQRQTDRFFDYWTLKESYIKARGMGLSLPLGQFSFHLQDNTKPVTISFGERIQDDPRRWQFWLMRPTARHRMAVCVETDKDKDTDKNTEFMLSISKVLPLAGPATAISLEPVFQGGSCKNNPA
jgi:4'-phosphopantetheinyl transferase